MHTTITITTEDLNRSRREVRKEIASWLRGVRNLRRHGQNETAAFVERHAADYKA